MRKWWKDTNQRYIVSHKISSSLLGKVRPKRQSRFDSVFNGKFTKQENGCFIWNGYTKEGYGYKTFKGKPHGVHRLAYILSKGKIKSSDLYVSHTCNNKLCINPDHLWVGTCDEVADRMMESNIGPISLITPEQKKDIKKYSNASYTVEEISKKFNIARDIVKFISKT